MNLEASALRVQLRGREVLRGVDLSAEPGELTAVLGANGAGKTTLIHTVMGIGPARRARGHIRLTAGGHTRDVSRWPAHRRARAGLALVPQGRRVFATLTVAEHFTLLPGPTTATRAVRQGSDPAGLWTVERLVTVFPQLGMRLTTQGRHLSGGEQQMLAIARALLTQPRLVLLDEPTEGLSPPLVQRVGQLIADLAAHGAAVLLATPDTQFARTVADQVTVVSAGRVTARFDGADLRTDPTRLHAVLTPAAATPGRPPASPTTLPARPRPPGAGTAGALVPTPPDREGPDR
jgi:branched-chain amino acid transport system ATP-binding protein